MPVLDQSLVLNQTGHLAYHEGEAERLLDISVNLKRDFDATGDGVTDDSASIAAAIDEVNGGGGGVLYAPAGIYSSAGNVYLKSGVRLVGAGADVTTFISGGDSINGLGIESGSVNVGLADLTVNGNRDTYSGNSTALGCSGNVDGLSLRRCRFHNGQSFTVFLDQVNGGYQRVWVDSCIFEDSGPVGAGPDFWDCFGTGDMRNSYIRNCLFRDCNGQAFSNVADDDGLESFSISYCNFEGEGTMGTAISLEPAVGALVEGNIIRNLADGTVAIYVRPAAASLVLDPKNILIRGNLIENVGSVSGTYTDYGVVLRNSSYCTIEGNVIRRMGRSAISIQSQVQANSGDFTKSILIRGNIAQDSNQDNAPATPDIELHHTGGNLHTVTIQGNDLERVNGDSQSSNGILEVGTVEFGDYSHNNVRAHISAGISMSGIGGSIARANPGFNTGNGSPEGVITAPVGTEYTDLAGGAGTTLYVKESNGAGNTGWAAK